MIDFKLIRITLFNFACYYGENTLDFTTKTDKNIFLFNVPNGSGKTTLFHAIKWGFYGESIEYFKDSDKISIKDFLNDRLDPSKDMCFVEITFEYGNKTYTLKRKYQPGVKKTSELSLSKGQDDILDVDEAQEMLNHINPQNFADFFMFDGEQLSRFMTAQKNIEQNYRDSILQLLGLKQIQILKDDLSKLEKRYDNELTQQKSTNKDVETKKKVINRLNKDINNEDVKIEKHNESIEQNDNYIEKLEEQRTRYAKLPKVMEDLDKINKDIRKQDKRSSDIESKLSSSSTNFFIKFIERDLKRYIDENNNKIRDLQDICGLSDMQADTQSAKEDILKKSIPKCEVCGHKLSDSEISKLKDEQERISESLKLFEKNKNERDNLKDENQQFMSSLRLLDGCDFGLEMDNLDELKNKIHNLEKAKKDLDKESQREEYGDLAKINREISSLQIQNTKNEDKIKIAKYNIKSSKREKEDITRDIKRLGHDDTNTVRITRNIDYLSKLIRLLDEALEIGTESKRHQILKKSNELFNEITNKPDEYSGIGFEDEESYAFIIKTKDNSPVKNPSRGEKQVLAMSFLLGLNQYTGRNNVILMDTPVASLDDVHSAGIGSALANLNNQVIFLAQPQELAGDIYKNMKPSVVKEFTVERNEYKSSFKEV
ncbi:AAA family ATPase [Methanococcoides burtonii]|uniref:Chromosome segregation domain protein n=1 Tax=Methanococcoides burtonii (strain DSM 6242 / NBRC 107633 / OCM 468 / ACE-M) TaxID=259564 RepID=Q12VT2_METBU|nr:AAA family ATPase [Methanococcoides burtonii]ABE52444.1 Chromosome segregation domain protein [Methanococcoides burtonii DSM 6242]